ncbi:MAG TPA: phosphopantetheinyl transferase [Chloroflexi bacterium]|jgi:4'-phosphopantetheinyl transferase|nr:phosphopantetheinyl transferase [Chloroflexota bacterium]
MNDDRVDVWSASLALHRPALRRLEKIVSSDERGRAERFRSDLARADYIVTRGLLRTILAGYLRVHPDEIALGRDGKGKPEIAGRLRREKLRFNVAHSGGRVAYAVTRGREVGIDLERIAHDVPAEALAERFFSEEEAAGIRRLPSPDRRQAFFTIWTLKEAYLKATGEGLRGLDQIDLSRARRCSADSWRVEVPGSRTAWSLRTFVPDVGYVGAVAVGGPGCRVRFLPALSARVS